MQIGNGSDGSGRRHRITVIMESRRNGPQLSSRHDDDDDDLEIHCKMSVYDVTRHLLMVNRTVANDPRSTKECGFQILSGS